MSLSESKKIKLDASLRAASWLTHEDLMDVIDVIIAHRASRLESASIQAKELILAAKTSSALQVEVIAGRRQGVTANGVLQRIQAHLCSVIQLIRGRE